MNRSVAIVGAYFCVLAPGVAAAQSSPGLVLGQIPSAAQWNAYFSAKLDVSALGITVAPLPLPAADLPAATSSVQGAMSLTTAGAQAPVQSAGAGLSLTGTALGLPSVNTSGSGMYNNITVDAFGRITAVRGFNSADITGALGFTPAATASPTFTGTPTAPTATSGTNTTQIATTAFIQTALASYVTASSAASTYAPLASPTFQGTVTVPSGSVLGTPASVNLSNASGLPYTALQSLSANTVLGSLTATTPSGLAVPSCSASNDALSWTSGAGFGCNTISTSGTAGGASTDVQYNNSSAFAGNSGFTYNAAGLITLGVAGTSNGQVQLNGSTSGSVTLAPPSGALGTATVTLPDGGTLLTTSSASSTYAPLASPTFTGSPAAPTAAAATNTTQLATTANVVSTIEAPPTVGYGATTAEPVNATTIAASGAITPSSTAGIVGTTAANNANAGSVGEYLSGNGSAVTMTNNSATNLTSVALSAGDWDVQGFASISCSGSQMANAVVGVGTSSATLPPAPQVTQLGLVSGYLSAFVEPTPMVRFNVSTSTTVYVVGYQSCGSGTLSGTGYYRARRVR